VKTKQSQNEFTDFLDLTIDEPKRENDFFPNQTETIDIKIRFVTRYSIAANPFGYNFPQIKYHNDF